MGRFRLAAGAIAVAQTAACAIPSVPAKLPPQDRAWIAVLSGELPEAVEQVARHAWIVGNLPGQMPVRWELMNHAFRAQTQDPFWYFGDGDVAVHGVVEGSTAEISRIRQCLDAEVGLYNERHPTYWPIPGPNSNTFIAESLRRCGIHIELPSTCIGRDYRGPIGAGVTESGTGVQLESWVAGVRVGLREGVEGHVTGLAIGPGGLELPVEARAELDAGRRVRLGLRGAAVWVPFVAERQGGSTLSFADELVLGTFVRIGRARTTSFGTMGRGHFFGLERHEVMHSFWLGLTYGVEIDFGG